MPENYEVIYSHPSGAMATFLRQGGELDALAKGLDSEQFWVFKQVKALLARNDQGDLGEANRMMSRIGFAPLVREITQAQPAPSVAAMREEAFAGAIAGTEQHAAEAHAGPHAPQPSIWPLYLALSAALTLISLIFIQDFGFVAVTLIGLALVLFCIVRWGTEAFHVEL